MKFTYWIAGDVTVYPVENGKAMKGKPVATFHCHRWQDITQARALAEALIASLEETGA